MKTAQIIHFKPTLLQRGLKTSLNLIPTSYVRRAGEPKPKNQIELRAYCYA